MCDTMVAVTADGLLFAKNSDRDANEAQILQWLPAQDHQQGAQVQATWIAIPQVAHTHAILISRPWWMWGAEMGTNEHGVTIGNQAVFTRQSTKGDAGLLGMDLLRLALERADTVAAAVEVIVSLLEEYGQNGSCSVEHPRFTYHNSFLVADRNEAIVVETAGRQWATERVIGRARSISNGLTIEPFAKSHADRLRGRVAQCKQRRACTESASALAQTPADLMAVLRDNGTDGAPRWSLVNGSMNGPNMHAGGLLAASQTVASWVSDLRGSPQHYATATADPALSIFKPVDVFEPVAMDAVTNQFSDALWWRHEQFHRLALRDWSGAHALIAAERDEVERRWQDESPSSAQAFKEAEAVTERWHDALRSQRLLDTRPWWLRRIWRQYDAAARLPEENYAI